MPFQHRRLIAYQRAVEFVIEAFAATERVSLRWRGMVDQIRRAATSVPLNIAEGVSESSPGEQSRFLRIARRSAAECDAGFHILHKAGAIPDAVAERAATNLNQIAAMLTRLIQHSDARGQNKDRRRTPSTKTDDRSELNES